MKSVLLIGLGRFGTHIAEKLNELHHQVLAVDRNEQRVNDALPLVTEAQIGDATSKSFLRKTANAAASSTASVVVFMPPAVEPGEPPTSMQTIIIAWPGSLTRPRSTVLKPAVRSVTD